MHSFKLPQSPPQDELQQVLGPLLSADPTAFEDQAGNPELLENEELLQWRPDGTPQWWPLHRDQNGGDWTSLRERRQVLLSRIRENLPADFPPTPSKHSELQRVVHTLRHIAYGLQRSVGSAILSSS